VDGIDPVEALEAKALKIAGGSYEGKVAAIEALLDTAPDQARKHILELVAPVIGSDLFAELARAFGMGVDGAIFSDLAMTEFEAKADISVQAALNTRLPEYYPVAAAAVGARVSTMLTDARARLRAGEDPASVFPSVRATRGVLSGGVTSLVNEAHADGVTLAAKATGEEMVLEPERDACVRCLAYAGQRSKDGTLPPRLTFGTVYPSMPGVQKCPIHPHCRCRFRIVRQEAINDVSKALEREAKRSILRGYALPTESLGTRLKATESLLKQGSGMPKSVDAFARRALKAGEYGEQGKPQGTKLAGRP
jgi:hypothetical protein